MTNRPARTAFLAAFADWRRHLAALALVAAAVGVASTLGSSVAYYGAALVAFSVWMAWFVLTVIEWLRHAEF